MDVTLRPLSNWLGNHVLILWIFVNVLDSVSTWTAIMFAGASEGNPAMAFLFNQFTLEGGLVIKMVAATLAGLTIQWKGNVQWLRIPTIFMAAVAINNSMHVFGAGI